MTNILLTDQHLPDSSVFIDSCNENTVPFLYSQDTTREQLLQFLQQTVPNSQIQRLCFAFEIKPNYIFYVKQVVTNRSRHNKISCKKVNSRACVQYYAKDWKYGSRN